MNSAQMDVENFLLLVYQILKENIYMIIGLLCHLSETLSLQILGVYVDDFQDNNRTSVYSPYRDNFSCHIFNRDD
ncbi:hypothetical protein ACFQZ1_03190 [Bacillus sp. CGMCC 1.60114]|uniref:hypothetical protein n=1 Tax=unclassified Bacillus (in: firmicutes) TaxID=185979 RepID=UPI00363B5D03